MDCLEEEEDEVGEEESEDPSEAEEDADCYYIRFECVENEFVQVIGIKGVLLFLLRDSLEVEIHLLADIDGFVFSFDLHQVLKLNTCILADFSIQCFPDEDEIFESVQEKGLSGDC